MLICIGFFHIEILNAICALYNLLFEARIRLDLVKLLACSSLKQKFDGPRLAQLEK